MKLILQELREQSEKVYDRENKALREAKNHCEDKLRQCEIKLDAMERSNDESRLALAKAHGDREQESASLRAEVKVKNYELERSTILMEEKTTIIRTLELDLEKSDRATNIAKFDLLRKPDTNRPSNQHAAVYAWGRELVLKSIFTPELYDAVTTGSVDADTVIGGHPTMKDRKKSAWQVEFGSRYKKAVDRISGRILPEEKDIAYNTAQIKKLLATMDTKMHGKKSVGFKSKNNKQATAAWKVLNSYFA